MWQSSLPVPRERDEYRSKDVHPIRPSQPSSFPHPHVMFIMSELTVNHKQ